MWAEKWWGLRVSLTRKNDPSPVPRPGLLPVLGTPEGPMGQILLQGAGERLGEAAAQLFSGSDCPWPSIQLPLPYSSPLLSQGTLRQEAEPVFPAVGVGD